MGFKGHCAHKNEHRMIESRGITIESLPCECVLRVYDHGAPFQMFAASKLLSAIVPSPTAVIENLWDKWPMHHVIMSAGKRSTNPSSSLFTYN